MAQGLWRCDSIVTQRWFEVRPAPGYPPALGVTVQVPCSSQRACGTEYYDATGLSSGEMEFCQVCGSNSAIGRCASDHRLVCGYSTCSAMRDGRRLCRHCITVLDAPAVEARKKAETAIIQTEKAAIEAAFSELAPSLNEFRAACSALSAIADPVDCFLVLLLLAQRTRKDLFSGGWSLPENASRKDDARRRAETEARTMLVAAADSLLGQRDGLAWDASAADPRKWAFKGPELVSSWSGSGRLRRSASTALRLVSRERQHSGKLKAVPHGHITGWQVGTGTRGKSGWSGAPDRYVLADGTIGMVPFKSRELPVTETRDRIGLPEVVGLFQADHDARPVLPGTVAASVRSLTGIAVPFRLA